MNPFVNVQVQPAYGKRTAFVTWVLQAGFDQGDIYVYRSPNGVSDWTLLNEDPVRGLNHFEDAVFVVENRIQLTHYRLVLELNGQEYLSPVIGMLGKLTRNDYAGARLMMSLELQRMRKGNGIQMLLFIPLTTGVPGPGVEDPRTNQQFNVATPSPDADCYGQRFVGGFAKPVSTWVELMDIGVLDIKEDARDNDNEDEQTLAARVLAFPRPRRDYMLVHVETDNRYVIGGAEGQDSGIVKPYYFKGVVPIAYDVKMQLLMRSDPRYRVPIPVQ